MVTPKLGLPTITDNQVNDVTRDFNALAMAIDDKVAPLSALGTALVASDVQPVGQAVGAIWLQTGIGEGTVPEGGNAVVAMQRVIVADDPPEDKEAVWMDT